ncbi:vacuolar ATP synthase [Theileria orientalis]|uniref:V-type proton ATPase subunit C n=1 Tax=Theileria orientalis TaxID=68886 RepID=A0A976QT24_THEOR|nr:vacuolar ATP synthase [Theileria orientalis]
MKQEADECWLISYTNRDGGNREELYTLLKKQLMKNHTIHDIGLFDVPFDLRFKAFDNLLSCADELEKEDQTVESSLKRARQLAMDTDPKMELKVHYEGRQFSLSNYITRFSWDDRKFPKYLPLSENLKNLSQLVSKLIDDLTLKAVAYNELRFKKNAMSSNMEASIIYRDLTYVITPDVVEDPNDFTDTEHLTTVVVFVPAGSENDFLNSYMSYSKYIVPNSAKKINVVSSNFTLWRVVLFKSSLEKFMESCKSNNFNVQKFIYSEERYKQLLEEQSKMEADTRRQQAFLSRIYDVAHSDIFIYWIHIKAMRIFCESVLKYGLPVQFTSFFIFPVSSKQEQLHKVLSEMLPKYSKDDSSSQKDKKDSPSNKLGDYTFLPYVFLNFRLVGIPFRPLSGSIFNTIQKRFIVKSMETADEYKSMILQDKMVLAKFSASWCKPCQKAKPVVEELSNELTSLNFIEVDVDNLPQIADEEGVKTIPFFKLFKGGKLLDEITGLILFTYLDTYNLGCDKSQLRDLISKHNNP